MTINIVSASGAQGRSVVSALLAKRLSAMTGKPALLVDGCSDGRAFGLLTDERGTAYDLGDALCGRCCVSDAIFRADGVDIIPCAADDADVRTERIPGLLRELAEEHELVVFDSPGGSFSLMAAVAEVADVTIVCCEADAFHLSAAYRLRRRLPEQDERCRLLVTRYSTKLLRAGRLQGVDRCIDRVGARLIGVVSEEPGYRFGDERSAVTRAVYDVAARLLGGEVPLGKLN